MTGLTLGNDSLLFDRQARLAKSLRWVNFLTASPLSNFSFGRFIADRLLNFLISLIKKRIIRQKVLIQRYTSRFPEIKGTDLSEKIAFLQRNIKTTSSTIHSMEKSQEELAAKKKEIDLKGVDSLLAESLELDYDLLIILKKANKKTPAPPSELGHQTANYSMNNLSRVINNGR